MEYMVKCDYCGETYFVNSNIPNAKFTCESCGAQNGKDDIIETISSVNRPAGNSDNSQDENVHFEWYLKIAQQGDSSAQFKIGYYYDTGTGVTQDYSKAVEWYTEAAEQGYAKVQFNLGNSYYKGEGVKKDIKEAKKWYAKVAAQGHAKAQLKLAELR